MKRSFNGCTFIFIGASGSGKGTQIKLLRKFFEKYSESELKTFASGDILRSDPEIKKLLAGGGLVDDGTIIPYFKKFLDGVLLSDNIILDGFPRTMMQAIYFNEAACVSHVRKEPVFIISLEIREEVAISRMLGGEGRGVANREEDNPVAIKRRLGWFNEKTKPTVDWFEKDPNYRVIRVNSEEKNPDEIHQEIVREIKKYF